jgi:amphiphysin
LYQIFKIADEGVREALPPLITACFSLLPYLLATQITIQNTMLGQYYTVLHTYCTEEDFPSPPPAMEVVIATWEARFEPIKQQIESTLLISRGSAVRQGNVRGGRTSNATDLRAKYGQRRLPSTGAAQLELGPSRANETKSPKALTYSREASSDTPQLVANFATQAPAGPGHDYFQAKLRTTTSRDAGSASPSLTALVAGKKKPPPPPPMKRKQEVWVMAQYDFSGQEPGDLSFSEGDRIRVLQKTDSTDDWWEGELGAVTGKFPANYCVPV